MKEVGSVNKIDKKTLPVKLKRGEVVRYQLLTGVDNPDREARRTNPIIYPMCNQIPSKDRIWDIHQEAHVDIALVGRAEKDTFTVRDIIIWGKSTGGQWACTGGSVADEELYEYLELCNYNESNPNRDTSIEPIFKRIDVVADANQRSKKRNVKLTAMKYAESLTNGEVKNLAASLNWNENEPIGVLRDRLETFAETDAEGFTKVMEGKGRDEKATLKRAMDAGKISYDSAQHRITHNGNTLIKLDRVEGINYLDQAADFLLHNKNGSKVFDTIKKLMQTGEAE